jgi:pimeloyl-ACP methyl ester carboxylesterase
MYQAMANLPGFGAIMQQLLKLRAFRRSPLAFGGCFHDLSYLDGPFHARFIEPLISSSERIEGVTTFLQRMKFSRLDEFQTLHGRLGMPVLFIWGADDPTFPEYRARQMLPQFPDVAGFHSVRDAKLFLHEEHPDEVAQLIGSFVS